MAARTLKHHKENPYTNYVKEQRMVVFTPNGYDLNLMVTCITPPALRCMLVFLSRLDADGSATASLTELRKILGSPTPTLSRAIGELELADLIKKKGNGMYWVKPTLARSLILQS